MQENTQSACIIEDVTDMPENVREGDLEVVKGEPEQEDIENKDFTPPDNCEKITPCGSVLKKVLQAGTGGKPPLHARCLVHFSGYLVENGTCFFNTRDETQSQEPKVVVAGRDASANEAGLHLGVASMCVGEKAALYITDPSFGYGERGSFSFPSVPPNSKLYYEVELVDWEAPDDDDRPGMLYEEKLEAAERRRKDGNALFQDGKYQEALAKYSRALSYLDEDFMMQLDGRYLEKAEEVKTPVHLNMAAVYIKLEDYNEAIHQCSQVLMSDKTNAKALFRRGKAKLALGQTEEAAQDLEAAAKQSPEDKAIQKELQELRKTQKAERNAQSKLFKGRLATQTGIFGGAEEEPIPSKTKESESGPDGEEVKEGREEVGRNVSGKEDVVAVKAGLGGIMGLLWALVAWLLAVLGLRKRSL